MGSLCTAPLPAIFAFAISACSGGNAASQQANASTFDPKGQTNCPADGRRLVLS